MGIEEMEGLVPSSSSSVHRWKHDVYVSFRGTDIRKTFGAHFFRELNRAGIYCFKDTDMEIGSPIESTLLDAIRHSRVSLVVFTTNYANSRWCLNELVAILECNRRFRDHQGHVVLPIFYDVERRDVRKQSGRFGDGFERCLATHTDDLLVQKWRDSLKEAGNLSGLHLDHDANGDQSDFIEKIVGHLLKIIPRTSSPDAIGVNSFVDDVISLMKIGSEDDVRVVGIWGMKGIGKTKVAKAVCRHIFREFEGVGFLENVGVANQDTLLLLQKRLLQDVLEVQNLEMYDLYSNINEIKTSLRQKKILLVLDNITEKHQIEYFGAGDRELFRRGSRILITTREEWLLKDLKVDDKYMLPGLGSKESLQLMSRHAFGEEGYEELFKRLIHYAGGLPVFPERIDSFLSSRKNQWREILEKLVRDPVLIVGTEPLTLRSLQYCKDFLDCPNSTRYCFELESNGSPDREDNHLSSQNEGRLHYSRSNDDLLMKLTNLPGGGGDIMSRIGKLTVLNTKIAKGSNGTIVFEGFHELRPVAVKRLVKGHHDHDDHVFNEIKNLTESDLHSNIVRYYGVEYDQHFVYLALERCACSLDDLIQAHSESSNNSVFPNDPASTVGYKSKLDFVRHVIQDFKLQRPDRHPSPILLDLMRDVVSGLAYLHVKGIIHRDLKPQNVLITKNPSLGAKLCDMGISRCLPQDKSSLGNHATGCGTSGWQAPEQLLHGHQTRAMDMFSLGCVLFFCVTGGGHPFGECLEDRDFNIKNNKIDLTSVESIPEAHDLISRLLNPDPKLRPKSLEVLRHPFFWNSETRLSFLRDTSDRVLLEDASAPDSDLLNELESNASLVFAGNWDSKIEHIFMEEISSSRPDQKKKKRSYRYKYSLVRDLLRAVRNKLSHYRELPPKVQELVGRVPEGYDNYFAERFLRLLMLSYEVVSQFCKEEEYFRKYFGSVDAV